MITEDTACEAPVKLRLLFSATRNVMNSESEVIRSSGSIKYDESKKMRVRLMILLYTESCHALFLFLSSSVYCLMVQCLHLNDHHPPGKCFRTRSLCSLTQGALKSRSTNMPSWVPTLLTTKNLNDFFQFNFFYKYIFVDFVDIQQISGTWFAFYSLL